MWNEDPLVGWGDVDVLRIKGGGGVEKRKGTCFRVRF